MGLRRKPRTKMVVPIRIWGTESTGQPFNILAHTLNVSSSGARVGGVKVQIGVGDAVTIQYKQKRALFKVAWVGRPGDPTQDQIGVALLEQDRQIWSEIQDPETFADNFSGHRKQQPAIAKVPPPPAAEPAPAEMEIVIPVEVLEATEDAPSPERAPETGGTDAMVRAVESPETSSDINELLRALARRLTGMEELVKRTPPNADALRAFRDAIAKIRQTVWGLQQWHETNKEGSTAFPLLAYLNEERLRFVIQATQDLANDRANKGVEVDAELLDTMFHSVDALRPGGAVTPQPPPRPVVAQSADQEILPAVKSAITQVQRSGMEAAAAAAYLAGELQRILSADGVAIARFQHGEMVCLGSSGNAAEPGMVLETENGLGAEAMQSVGLIYCPDTQSDPRVDAALCKEAGIRSVVMVAVRGGVPMGVIEVFSGRAHGFGGAQLDALQRFAEMMGPLLAEDSATESASLPRN